MTELLSWPEARGLLQIRYSPAAIERVRRHAAAEAARMRRAGGLLVGERAGANVQVLDAEAFRTPDASATSLNLSAEELHRNRQAIETGLRPVIGWYISRPNAGLEMSPEDISLFRDLFPAEWQIALVLAPGINDASRGGDTIQAAFFFRDAAGELVQTGIEMLGPSAPRVTTDSAAFHPVFSPQDRITMDFDRRRGGALSWIAIAIAALAAGAGIYEIQDHYARKSPTPAALQHRAVVP